MSLGSKAFDKANRYGLYIKLMKRNFTKHFKISIHESCSRFYKELNGIYSESKGNMDEMFSFQLINAYCKPLLNYAYVSNLIAVIYHSWIGLGILYSEKYLKLIKRMALLIFRLVYGNYQFLWVLIQEKWSPVLVNLNYKKTRFKQDWLNYLLTCN